MKKTFVCVLAALAALSQTAAAQDAKTVIANASKAMGIEGVSSIHYYGVAEQGNLGQNNNANQPWPMQAANDYVRTIDFTQGASRATWMNYAVPVTGGAAALTPAQQIITPEDNKTWAAQVETWITPWGFLKAAAANNPTVHAQSIGGKRYEVVTFDAPVKSPGGVAYKMVGFIDSRNLVEKVRTWVENPIFGDMLVEAEYTFYRDGANGLKFPAQWVQKRGGWPTFTAYVLGADANPANLRQLLTPPPGRGAGRGGEGRGGEGRGSAAPTSEKLAEGVYRINGAYNSLAVEFADYILLFEPGPQNEARAQAIIAEAKRVIPNKPIRFGVISHHHFDHTSGLPAVVAEGITIVTPEVNRDFLMTALSAPRTLAPDSMSRSGKKPIIEGFKGDKRVFEDATRTFEVHVIQGLPHADGIVIGYLPKEKILVYADMFNLPPPNAPVPDLPIVGTMVFMDNIDRLRLDADKVMSIHSLNPDRLTSLAEIKASLGRK
jgi:glyoxylase-like metal-dependent hydrolase (beta-lactamase superfamily II)